MQLQSKRLEKTEVSRCTVIGFNLQNISLLH
jgi:hypothetical protein